MSEPINKERMVIELVLTVVLHGIAAYHLGWKMWIGLWCLLCAHRIANRQLSQKRDEEKIGERKP